MSTYRVMMRMETGEEVRACDETFNNEDSADDRAAELEDQHEECTFWVERDELPMGGPL